MMRQIKSIALVLLGALLFSTACHASRSSCPPDTEPPKQKPVLYEVKDQSLWRHETETDRYTLVTDIQDVQSVTQSVLNCISQSARSHEPNMVIVSKTDGSVWIKGVIWDYAFDECAVVECENPHGPQRMLDTQGQWKQIVGFKDVVKVAAGETWVLALTRSGGVFSWGTLNGTRFWDALPKDEQRHVLPLEYTTLPVFNLSAYVDVIAFHNAAYGLAADGQVTAWGDGRLLCRIEAQRRVRGFAFYLSLRFFSTGDGGAHLANTGQARRVRCSVR